MQVTTATKVSLYDVACNIARCISSRGGARLSSCRQVECALETATFIFLSFFVRYLRFIRRLRFFRRRIVKVSATSFTIPPKNFAVGIVLLRVLFLARILRRANGSSGCGKNFAAREISLHPSPPPRVSCTNHNFLFSR